MRARAAALVLVVAGVLVAGCGEGEVAITEQARDDLTGRVEAVGLAIAAGESGQASDALEELVSQAERYAEDGQIDEERLTAITTAAEELANQLGTAVEIESPPTTSVGPGIPPAPTTAPPPVDEEDDDDGGGGEGRGGGNGRGRGNGDD